MKVKVRIVFGPVRRGNLIYFGRKLDNENGMVGGQQRAGQKQENEQCNGEKSGGQQARERREVTLSLITQLKGEAGRASFKQAGIAASNQHSLDDAQQVDERVKSTLLSDWQMMNLLTKF